MNRSKTIDTSDPNGGRKSDPLPARPKALAGKRSTTTRKPVTLLKGGNPQIPKGDGDDPVQAYIRSMPGWKSDLGHRLDTLIVKTVPNVKKAVKWNSPFYGTENRGYFLSFHTFTNYIKVTFFNGISLQPPPSGGTGKEARWIDIHEDDLDEEQLTNWIEQASKLPGWSI